MQVEEHKNEENNEDIHIVGVTTLVSAVQRLKEKLRNDSFKRSPDHDKSLVVVPRNHKQRTQASMIISLRNDETLDIL